MEKKQHQQTNNKNTNILEENKRFIYQRTGDTHGKTEQGLVHADTCLPTGAVKPSFVAILITNTTTTSPQIHPQKTLCDTTTGIYTHGISPQA